MFRDYIIPHSYGIVKTCMMRITGREIKPLLLIRAYHTALPPVKDSAESFSGGKQQEIDAEHRKRMQSSCSE